LEEKGEGKVERKGGRGMTIPRGKTIALVQGIHGYSEVNIAFVFPPLCALFPIDHFPSQEKG
jgi:hypothetical protein